MGWESKRRPSGSEIGPKQRQIRHLGIICVFFYSYIFLYILTNVFIVYLGPNIDICDGKSEGGQALAKSGPNNA